MKQTHSFLQGSPEWEAHRSKHLNASDASAAMGLSRFKTRSELMRDMATGITVEYDDATLARFAAGHEFEEIARPWAEEIIGSDLFPVVMSDDINGLPLSASFDGIDMAEEFTFEHKTANAALLAALEAGDIPSEYKPQIEQGLLISGATRCLFMASAGDKDAMRYAWYESDPDVRASLLAAWGQFSIDLANFEHAEAAQEVVAAPQMALPALSIQVNGSISLIDNLEIFGRKLTDFIAGLPEKPTTDQAFADAEAAVKTLKAAEEALDAAESSALAQTASIDQMRRTVGLYRDQARTARLMLDKIVKSRKDSIRFEIIQEYKTALVEHIKALNSRIDTTLMPPIAPDWAAAIKGKKLISSIRDACDAELARAKIEANAIADKIDANLKTLDAEVRKTNVDYSHLFRDYATLVLKAPDDLALVIASRIDAENKRHAAETARILEAEREKIRAEEEARAAAKVKAEQEEVERQRIAAEAAAAKVVSDRAYEAIMEEHRMLERARGITEPATQSDSTQPPKVASPELERRPAVVAAIPDVREADASQVEDADWVRLRFRLDNLAAHMNATELADMCIHAAHILAKRKEAA